MAVDHPAPRYSSFRLTRMEDRGTTNDTFDGGRGVWNAKRPTLISNYWFRITKPIVCDTAVCYRAKPETNPKAISLVHTNGLDPSKPEPTPENNSLWGANRAGHFDHGRLARCNAREYREVFLATAYEVHFISKEIVYPRGGATDRPICSTYWKERSTGR